MNATLKKLQRAALDVLGRAYAPYSGYRVACCLETDTGALFTGVNVENAAYNLCICAEASAIVHMVNAGHKCIRQLLVLAENDEFCSPCGSCRQRIYEFASPECKIHLSNSQQIYKTLRMEELLPYAFTFIKLDKK